MPPGFTGVVTPPFTKRVTVKQPMLLAGGKPFMSFDDNIHQALVQQPVLIIGRFSQSIKGIPTLVIGQMYLIQHLLALENIQVVVQPIPQLLLPASAFHQIPPPGSSVSLGP